MRAHGRCQCVWWRRADSATAWLAGRAYGGPGWWRQQDSWLYTSSALLLPAVHEMDARPGHHGLCPAECNCRSVRRALSIGLSSENRCTRGRKALLSRLPPTMWCTPALPRNTHWSITTTLCLLPPHLISYLGDRRPPRLAVLSFCRETWSPHHNTCIHGKQETFTKGWFNVGLASKTVA